MMNSKDGQVWLVCGLHVSSTWAEMYLFHLWPLNTLNLTDQRPESRIFVMLNEQNVTMQQRKSEKPSSNFYCTGG